MGQVWRVGRGVRFQAAGAYQPAVFALENTDKPTPQGYWIVGGGGKVQRFGTAKPYGSANNPQAAIGGMASRPDDPADSYPVAAIVCLLRPGGVGPLPVAGPVAPCPPACQRRGALGRQPPPPQALAPLALASPAAPQPASLPACLGAAPSAAAAPVRPPRPCLKYCC